MDVLDRNPQGLQAECRETLRKRREMYNTAIKVGNRRLTSTIRVQNKHAISYFMLDTSSL